MTRRLVLSALVLLSVAACGADAPIEPVPEVDTALVLSPSIVQLGIGGTRQLAAALVLDDTDTVTVQPTWVTRNGGVASVTAAGLVTGVGEGATMIVASAIGFTDSVPVTVTVSAPVFPALRLVTDQLAEPVFATARPGDLIRLYVVEKGGVVRVVRNDSLQPSPFLDIAKLVSTGSEQGLLSIAFHPNATVNGYVYAAYTDTVGTSKVVRYRVSGPEAVDAGSAFEILSVAQPFTNHNGGQIAFGPDGKLYVGLGDGGSGGDPLSHGQDRATLLGAMLRLDVDAGSPYAIPADNPFVGDTSARGEIWAYGLRNPWRFSFDRSAGDLYIADVGQAQREEINVQSADSLGGQNYGWNVMEGSTCYGAATCSTAGLTLPVAEYTHTEGCSVTGGYVYRGSDISSIQGHYFYADYCAGFVRSFRYEGGAAVEPQVWPDLSPGRLITSFGQDGRGELYIMTQGGGLYRFVPN